MVGKRTSTSPRGAYIWRGDLTEGFLRYEFGGLIFGGAEKIAGAFLTACSNSSISNKTLKKLLERKKVPTS